MKIALDPYMFRTTPLLELPGLVADLGYEYIELSPREDFIPFFKPPAGGRGDDPGVPARRSTAAGVEVSRCCRCSAGRVPTRTSAQAAVRYWKRVDRDRGRARRRP